MKKLEQISRIETALENLDNGVLLDLICMDCGQLKK